MSLPALGSYVLSEHVFIFPEGDSVTVPAATGPASKTNKPGAADPLWIDTGVVSDSDIEPSIGNEIEIWGGTPGKVALIDAIEVKPKLTIKWTSEQITPYHVELLFRSLRLTTSSTQFNPLEGKTKKAWGKFQFYDQDDVLRLTLDVWGRLKITGGVKMGGGELMKPSFEFLVLHSLLNTAAL